MGQPHIKEYSSHKQAQDEMRKWRQEHNRKHAQHTYTVYHGCLWWVEAKQICAWCFSMFGVLIMSAQCFVPRKRREFQKYILWATHPTPLIGLGVRSLI